MSTTYHYTWMITLGGSALAKGNTYRYPASDPKPCVHPLRTPSGRTLSGFMPSDHPWHRGLWFAIKFVDQDNFWEEVQEDGHGFGRQSSEADPELMVHSDGSSRLTHRLAWRRPLDGAVALREERSLLQFPGDPAANRPTRIFWHTRLTAVGRIHLDRTPFKTWGGYGGMAFRASRELHDVKFWTPEGQHVAISGDAHAWVGLDGLLDGGADIAAGMAIFVDPKHVRYPLPIYAKSRNGFTYANAAFLFHEGLDLSDGETQELRYMIAVADGRWTLDRLKTEQQVAEAQWTATTRA